MLNLKRSIFALLVLFICVRLEAQTRFNVSSQAEFTTAFAQASIGDSIVWASGTYSNVFMDLTKNNMVVTAASAGSVIFNGSSRVEIDGNDVTLSGVQYLGGNIGTSHVIRIYGDRALITQINIEDYICYKYLIIESSSQNSTVSYSNFENRLNLDDQNILSVLVDSSVPGYHKIQYCSFKNFDGTGNDMGIEPIRIGVSTQGQFDSRTIVEYCYFTKCDGDGELISNKASQNIIRYNTFENNTLAELVLRHGDEAIVYGNFFLNGMGGVRVREGQGHYIYNNYFEGLTKRAIYIQNDPSDPVADVFVYFNTIYNSAELLLGGTGDYPPDNVVFANNIFASPRNSLLKDPTGNELWLGNMSYGTLGITRPAGIENTNPSLVTNAQGFVQIGSASVAIDAAVGGYPVIQSYEGVEFDYELLLDLMKKTRPTTISQRDVGAVEYLAGLIVKPHVDETNTGPSYLNGQTVFNLTTSVYGYGSITRNPDLASYPAGTSVTITANPDANNQFVAWGGDISGSENPKTIVVTDEFQISASFEQILSLNKVNTVQFYPNPVEKQLIIVLPKKGPREIVLEFYGQSGKLMEKSVVLVKADQTFVEKDVSELTSGAYFIMLKNLSGRMLEGSQVIKMVKK